MIITLNKQVLWRKMIQTTQTIGKNKICVSCILILVKYQNFTAWDYNHWNKQCFEGKWGENKELERSIYAIQLYNLKINPKSEIIPISLVFWTVYRVIPCDAYSIKTYPTVCIYGYLLSVYHIFQYKGYLLSQKLIYHKEKWYKKHIYNEVSTISVTFVSFFSHEWEICFKTSNRIYLQSIFMCYLRYPPLTYRSY